MIDWDALVIGPCFAAFGEDLKGRYTRAAGGGPFDVDVIFDDAHMAVVMSADGGPEISTIEPVAGVRRSQFPADPAQGDRLEIPRVGKTFVVNDPQPDGKGVVLLRLTRALP